MFQEAKDTERDILRMRARASILRYYPDSADNYVIPDSAGDLALNVAKMNTQKRKIVLAANKLIAQKRCGLTLRQ